MISPLSYTTGVPYVWCTWCTWYTVSTHSHGNNSPLDENIFQKEENLEFLVLQQTNLDKPRIESTLTFQKQNINHQSSLCTFEFYLKTTRFEHYLHLVYYSTTIPKVFTQTVFINFNCNDQTTSR